MKINEIYCGDCLDLMKDMPDKSVDLVLTDPPYNINKAEWDHIDNYVEWLGSIFLECQRVLKDNGSFYFFHNDFLQIVEIQNWISKNTDFKFKQLITWSKIKENFKSIGYIKQRLSIDMMRNYYGGFTEYCLYYTFQDETGLEAITEEYLKPQNEFAKYLRDEIKRSGKTPREIAALFPSKTGGLTGCVSNWLNGDNIITEEQYLKIRAYLNNEYLRKEYEYLRKEYEYLRKEYEYLRKEYEEKRYTFNTSRLADGIRSNSNTWLYEYAPKNGHVTPKPVDLIRNIINHSSNKGQIVFDPFLGSGTTAVACINTGRQFIGIEKDEDYFKIASDRIRDAQAQTRLF